MRQHLRSFIRRQPALRRLLNLYRGAPTNARSFKCDPVVVKPLEDMGEIERFFWENDAEVIDKWHHYLPIYDRHFLPFKDKEIRFLEIGVHRGGSMAMWRSYFGDAATIFGVDIDPRCAELDGKYGQVRIGSQDDPDFLRSVVSEMGGIDIVLDDGSHMMRHINRTIDILYPLLENGGIYAVEDLHCSYFNYFGGAKRRRNNFINRAKRIIDDMHHWYSQLEIDEAVFANNVTGVHFYDSIAILDKGLVGRPKRSAIGRIDGRQNDIDKASM